MRTSPVDVLFTALVLVCATFIWGCTEGRTPEPAGRKGPGGVTVGMDRSEVLQRMLEEVKSLQMSGQVRNPYSREFRQGSDGALYEILFYYAGAERGDNQVSDDELVPVLLVEGKVVGWGREEMERLNIQ